MSEPVTVYSPNGEARLLHAPSAVRQLLQEGWTLTPPQAAAVDEPQETVKPEPPKPAGKGRAR